MNNQEERDKKALEHIIKAKQAREQELIKKIEVSEGKLEASMLYITALCRKIKTIEPMENVVLELNELTAARFTKLEISMENDKIIIKMCGKPVE